MTANQTQPKIKKISQSNIPGVSLEQASRVPFALAENYAKSPTRPLDVAVALNMSPKSGPFRQLCGAAIGYGLTDGGPNAPAISLTSLGERIVTPLEEGDDVLAKKEAVLIPTVERLFLEKYDGSPLPVEKIAYNVLESFGVPKDRTKSVYELITQNAEGVGFLKKIKDKTYVDIHSPNGKEFSNDNTDSSNNVSGVEAEELPLPNSDKEVINENIRSNPRQNSSTAPKPIFIAHGKNKKPLNQLIAILDGFNVPYKVAVNEANAGRPIPQKIKDLMNECGSAIFIFSKDGENSMETGETIPNLNVVFELGASSVLYGEKVVIFKEDGLKFPSDFDSLGYISFEQDKLDAQAMNLFKELISMGFLKVVAA